MIYGTAAYIKVVYQNSTSCSIIIGKSKLASMEKKLVTIPRLVFQPALMASRIKVAIVDQMDMAIDSVFLWPDSLNCFKLVMKYKNQFWTIHCATMQRNSSQHERRRLEIYPLPDQYCRYFVTWHLIRQILFIKYLVHRSKVFSIKPSV